MILKIMDFPRLLLLWYLLIPKNNSMHQSNNFYLNKLVFLIKMLLQLQWKKTQWLFAQKLFCKLMPNSASQSGQCPFPVQLVKKQWSSALISTKSLLTKNNAQDLLLLWIHFSLNISVKQPSLTQENNTWKISNSSLRKP